MSYHPNSARKREKRAAKECELKWNTHQQIMGKGPLSFVYKGTFNNESVAVKRISLNHIGNSSKKFEEFLMNHDIPNVVKMFHVEDDSCFRYIPAYITSLYY